MMGKAARRSAILMGIACLLLILASCSREQTVREFEPLALDQFPQALGRGFPQVAAVPEGQRAVVGEDAPDFSFVLADEQGTSLADLTGKPVVINFWATWCGPCRQEMPDLVALHEENPDLIVLAVNLQEDMERVRPFAEEFAMTMTVILDAEGKVGRAYGVRGLPITIFINSDRKIASRWDGMLTASLLAERVAALQ
jgi:cytochrome c biogenesis protein CcmG, thiol:disulfide interchange protein DsbE